MQLAGPIGMAAFADGGGPAWWRKEIDKLNKTPAERGAELKKSMQYSDGAPRDFSAQFFAQNFGGISAQFSDAARPPQSSTRSRCPTSGRSPTSSASPSSSPSPTTTRAPTRRRRAATTGRRGRRCSARTRGSRCPACLARSRRRTPGPMGSTAGGSTSKRDDNHALKIQPGLRMLPSRSSWRPSGSVRSTSSSTRAGGGGAASFARCAGKSSRQ